MKFIKNEIERVSEFTITFELNVILNLIVQN
jgi:hypothetical protein